MKLDKVFCEQHCVQMTILTPGTIKKLNRERTSFLDGVCLNYEQLFHPLDYSTCGISQGGSIDKLILPRAVGSPIISKQLLDV